MKAPVQTPLRESEEWARRKRANVRLGLVFGGIVVALFLLSLWKYRPL